MPNKFKVGDKVKYTNPKNNPKPHIARLVNVVGIVKHCGEMDGRYYIQVKYPDGNIRSFYEQSIAYAKTLPNHRKEADNA